MDDPKAWYPSGQDPIPDVERYVEGNPSAFMNCKLPTKETFKAIGARVCPPPCDLNPPITFGPLSTVVQLRDGGRLRKFVYGRRDLGVSNHGFERKNAWAYERAKFNPLRHPDPQSYNNPNYGTNERRPVEGLEKEVLDLFYYPNVANTVMRGPYWPKPGAFKSETAEQPRAFTAVFSQTELAGIIFRYLFSRREDLNHFFRTCQFSAAQFWRVTSHYNTSAGDYMGLDKPSTSATNGDSSGKSYLAIFSPVRGNDNSTGDESNEDERNEFGFPSHKARGYPDKSMQRHYERTLMHELSMFRALHNIRLTLRCVMFHGCQWLNMFGLNSIVPELENLEVLSVAHCSLLTFEDTVGFVQLIGTFNDYHIRSDNNRLIGDFTPKYFYGPRENRAGEYGVIPQCEGHIDTINSVAAHLIHVYKECMVHKVDLFTPGTGFRLWLDMLPWHVGTLPHILEAIANICELYDHQHHDRWDEDVDTWSEYKGTCHLNGRDPDERPLVSRNMLREMETTVWTDLSTALVGKPVEVSYMDGVFNFGRDDPEMQGLLDEDKLFCVVLLQCCICNCKLVSELFTREQACRQLGSKVCHGCQLLEVMRNSTYNFHTHRMKIADRIFKEFQFTSGKLLEKYDFEAKFVKQQKIGNPNPSEEFQQYYQRLKKMVKAVRIKLPLDRREQFLFGRVRLEDLFNLGKEPNRLNLPWWYHSHVPDSEPAAIKTARQSLDQHMSKKAKVLRRIVVLRFYAWELDFGAQDAIRRDIEDCERRIEHLAARYHEDCWGTGESAGKNSDLKEKFRVFILQRKAELGEAQITKKGGREHSANEVARSWERAVHEYRALYALQNDAWGRVCKQPYYILDAANFAFENLNTLPKWRPSEGTAYSVGPMAEASNGPGHADNEYHRANRIHVPTVTTGPGTFDHNPITFQQWLNLPPRWRVVTQRPVILEDRIDKLNDRDRAKISDPRWTFNVYYGPLPGEMEAIPAPIEEPPMTLEAWKGLPPHRRSSVRKVALSRDEWEALPSHWRGLIEKPAITLAEWKALRPHERTEQPDITIDEWWDLPEDERQYIDYKWW